MIRSTIILTVAALLTSLVSPAMRSVASPTIMLPAPMAVETHSGNLHVEGKLILRWSGCKSAMLDSEVARFQNDIEKLSGILMTPNGGPELDISCQTNDIDPAEISVGENYALSITPHQVKVDAVGPVGVFRALATLRQLLDTSSKPITLPILDVRDGPRFQWRGLMIDTARHFISVGALQRQIDAMELVKLNVLHLHLSDNEGFRVASARYPKLTQAASNSQYYSQNEIRDLVRYANAHGVTIVPEFDLPGHVLAILKAYPELATNPIDSTNPATKYQAALDPTSDRTYAFVKGLLEEMAGLFTGPYMHVGGDEVPDDAWNSNSAIQRFMREKHIASKIELEGYFHRYVRGIVLENHKKMIGWEEINEESLPSDVTVQTWQTSNSTAKATAQNHPVIVSAGYYLDWLWPSSAYYAIDPLDASATGMMSMDDLPALRANQWFRARSFNAMIVRPIPPLTPHQQQLVMGGEAALWTEDITEEMLDGRVWPAACAVAERFWSPANLHDAADLYRRLPRVEDELRILGLLDDANRRRMVARLAPGQTQAVMTFLETVAPVRNLARMHSLRAIIHGDVPPAQEFNSLADAASSDSLAAIQFSLDVDAYLKGDRSTGPSISSALSRWRDNERLYTEVAKDRPAVAEALPIATEVATLAGIGMSALDALQHSTIFSAADATRAAPLFEREQREEQASADVGKALLLPQPPADLLIIIGPSIRALVNAAAGTH